MFVLRDAKRYFSSKHYVKARIPSERTEPSEDGGPSGVSLDLHIFASISEQVKCAKAFPTLIISYREPHQSLSSLIGHLQLPESRVRLRGELGCLLMKMQVHINLGFIEVTQCLVKVIANL